MKKLMTSMLTLFMFIGNVFAYPYYEYEKNGRNYYSETPYLETTLKTSKSSKDVASLESKIEEKYPAKIIYDKNLDPNYVYTILEDLQKAYRSLTHEYLEVTMNNGGMKINIVSEKAAKDKCGEASCTIYNDSYEMYLSLPEGENSLMLILHEMGHIFNHLISSDKGLKDFVDTNFKYRSRGYEYDEHSIYPDYSDAYKSFVSAKANQSLEDDIAETYAYMLADKYKYFDFKFKWEENTEIKKSVLNDALDEYVSKATNHEDVPYSKYDEWFNANKEYSANDIYLIIINDETYEFRNKAPYRALYKNMLNYLWSEEYQLKSTDKLIQRRYRDLMYDADRMAKYLQTIYLNDLDIIKEKYSYYEFLDYKKNSELYSEASAKCALKDTSLGCKEVKEAYESYRAQYLKEEVKQEEVVETLDLSAYTDGLLDVYPNSRVTSIKEDGNTIILTGYAFVKGLDFNKANALYRELIFVNVDDLSTDSAYRVLVKSIKGGSFLTANKNLNPQGVNNYDYATYTCTFSRYDVLKYNKSVGAMKRGQYYVFVRVSDGKHSKLFPLQNQTLSNGTKLELSDKWIEEDSTKYHGLILKIN